MVEIREVPSPEGMKEIFPVARSAWGIDRAESFIADMLNALKYHGGLVLGAYDEGGMVGFQYSFIGRRRGMFYLYSHMTGVIEERKHAGIGYELKLAQKRWALENGFGLVAWTFDPLMSLNAKFNIRKLGVIARTYRPNFYGEMSDRLNRGVETDRFVAEWWVGSGRVAEDFDPAAIQPAAATEAVDGKLRRIAGVSVGDENALTVEIPHSFADVKASDSRLAADWRLKSRALFADLFSRDYTAVSFSVLDGRSFYLLRRGFRHSGIPLRSPFSL